MVSPVAVSPSSGRSAASGETIYQSPFLSGALRAVVQLAAARWAKLLLLRATGCNFGQVLPCARQVSNSLSSLHLLRLRQNLIEPSLPGNPPSPSERWRAQSSPELNGVQRIACCVGFSGEVVVRSNVQAPHWDGLRCIWAFQLEAESSARRESWIRKSYAVIQWNCAIALTIFIIIGFQPCKLVQDFACPSTVLRLMMFCICRDMMEMRNSPTINPIMRPIMGMEITSFSHRS